MHDFGPHSHLHARRRDNINNKVLYQHAVNSDLPQFILSKRFTMKTWYPASISLRDGFVAVPNDDMLPGPEDKAVGEPDDTGYFVHKDLGTHQLGDKVWFHTIQAIRAFPDILLIRRFWLTLLKLSSGLRTFPPVFLGCISLRSPSQFPC